MAFITRFNLVPVWSKIVQILTYKSSKWVRHNQVSWSSFSCVLLGWDFIASLYMSLYVIPADQFLATQSTMIWIIPSMCVYSNINPYASFSFPGLTQNTKLNCPSPSSFRVDCFELCFVSCVNNAFSSLFGSCSFLNFLEII